jgi:hypothetical protein
MLYSTSSPSLRQLTIKVGISCTVFEQDTSHFQRPRDWNFGLYWAQSRLDECLTDDIKALIQTVETDPSYVSSAESVLPMYNGKTGELLKNTPAPWSHRFSRRKWLQLLTKDIDIQVGLRLLPLNISLTDISGERNLA